MHRRVLLVSLLLVGCTGNDDVEKIGESHYPQPSSHGAKLLKHFCSECHAPPFPSTHTAEEWPNVVLRMQQHRVSKVLTPMTKAQIQELTAYLQHNAKDAS